MSALPGVDIVKVNPVSFRMTVTPEASFDAVQRAVADLGYTVEPAQGRRAEHAVTPGFWPRHGQKVVTIGSGLALAVAWLVALRLGEGHGVVVGLCVTAALIGGFQTFRGGLRSLGQLEFDMNALMTIGVAGAFLLGEWAEGGAIAFLYAVSNWLEAATMQRTRGAIQGLIALAPRTARVKGCSGEAEVPVEDVKIDDVIVVRPGEKLALDGVVVEGSSAVDQAPITGESMPVAKAPGAEVFAGSINGAGALEVQVTRRVEDTTLARIVHLVEEAQAERAPVQTFVDRFARRYTPIVLVTALALALVPPLLLGQAWGDWVYRALALLVLACPCALVISTPVALVAGIGNAARRGVLIKGGTHLEQAASIRVVAFDKTGTLTRGRPEVQAVVPFGAHTESEVLRLAAAVESRSEHPLASAIVRRAEAAVGPVSASQSFVALVGHGARATVEGRVLFVGSPRYFVQRGMAFDESAISALQEAGQTVVLLGDAHEVFGLVAIADPVRPDAPEVVAALRREGVERVVMLTGDNARTARAIAERIGLDEVHADLLPEDKVSVVKALEARYGRVAMVGDGVNDAPALATAHLGIAMGTAGTDAAIETADVAL
ncbi:MAG: heavy metal translocating P-type ATPase, partial [Candidatus Sericytochromatia bacterium]